MTIDGTQLERLYDAHASALYPFLLSLTGAEADARDLLQELYTRIATRPELLTNVRQERPFLLTMAYRLFLDSRRRGDSLRRAHERSAQEPSAPDASLNGSDRQVLAKALREALARLPLEQRTVVQLKLWEEMSFDAIGELLGISLNTAASRYRYGIDKLRRYLRPFYEDFNPVMHVPEQK